MAADGFTPHAIVGVVESDYLGYLDRNSLNVSGWIMLLIALTAILSIGVDRLSRFIRSRLRLSNPIEQT